MAKVVNGNQILLNNGKTVTAQQGGWYDAAQFWGGTLSQPGQINSQSNQPGAGGMVSNEVIAQTNPANVAYVAQQRQVQNLPASPATGVPAQPVAQPTAQPVAQQPIQAPTATPGSPVTGFNQPTIDLPSMYNNLQDTSGVKEKTAQITDYEKKYLEAKNKISDNPFLDASTMDKRIQRLTNTYEATVKPIQDEIALKNTDIQNQLKLQTDQFNINSTQAQLALTQFQTLVSSGAYDNADTNSIISAANATGLSTSMIQSIVAARNKKDVKTEVIKWDDNINQGFAVINSATGEIINKQTIGATSTKPTGSGSDAKAGSGEQLSQAIGSMATKVTSRLNSYGDIGPADWQAALSAWLAAGLQREDFIKNFGQYADTNRGDFESAYGFAKP